MHILTHIPVEALSAVTRQYPELEWTRVPQEGEVAPALRGEVLLTFAWGSANLPSLLDHGLKWIHTIGTGVDRFPLEALAGHRECILTCSRGASAIPIAEWVMAMLLAFEKHLPEAWISEPPERWNRFDLGGLHGRTLGLLGLGGIGLAVARRALPFGMRVLAHRRSEAPSPLEGVECVSFDRLLSAADHLVIAAPATAATRGVIGAEALRRVKPGVHLVNVSRGALVDQEALRPALEDGRVARASLDTVEPEPLPAGHWLYTHPRVRLSPHCSWNAPDALDTLYDSFARNIAHYQAGEPLEGRVDLGEGY